MRTELMLLHMDLATGSNHAMEAANMILRLLNTGRLMLGSSELECEVISLLQDMGVPVRFIWSWAYVNI